MAAYKPLASHDKSYPRSFLTVVRYGFDVGRVFDQEPPMFPGLTDQERAAALVAAHDIKARQIVADRIMAAVRRHDLAEAKKWDRIGDLVDARLLLSI